MSTTSLSQTPDEEFNATLKLPTGNFSFKANKINIKESIDASGNKCWELQAFHDILKDSPPQSGLAGIKEVIVIHLYIGDELSVKHQPLVPSNLPPSVIKNSGNLFKIVDKKPDKENLIDTIDNYLGIEGIISYAWNKERTRIKGTFSFLVLDCDDPRPDTDIQITNGNFNLLNRGQHLI